MNDLDNIFERIAAQQPTLADADALCDRIMANLPPQQPKARPLWPMVTAWLSSAAAIALLVLCVLSANDSPVEPEQVATVSVSSVYEPLRSARTLNEARAMLADINTRRSPSISTIKKHFAR